MEEIEGRTRPCEVARPGPIFGRNEDMNEERRTWIDRIADLWSKPIKLAKPIQRPRFSGVDPSRWKLAPSSEDRPDVEGHPLRVLAALIDRGEDAPLCPDAGALLADLGQDRLYELLTMTAGLMDDDRVRMALREVRSSLAVISRLRGGR